MFFQQEEYMRLFRHDRLLNGKTKNLFYMNRPNRDLLVLFKQELMSPQAMEHEVEMLHELLYTLERSEKVVAAHELIDLTKYKIVTKPHLIRIAFRQREDKPFVFLNNKN
jgi:hypothetical protein